VPDELLVEDRWIRRSPTKVPLTVSGRPASSTNPATWTSHDRAARSSVGVGLGFVLDGDGIACIDLDHCFNGGELSSAAHRVLSWCPPTWMEISPSGDGLHIWGTSSIDFTGYKTSVAGSPVEVYSSLRYLTVTGIPFGPHRSLANLDSLIRRMD
jgi:primase-polymerase (primpol)-like protein